MSKYNSLFWNNSISKKNTHRIMRIFKYILYTRYEEYQNNIKGGYK